MRDKKDSQAKWWWKWVVWVFGIWFLMGLMGLPYSWDRWTDQQYLSAIFFLILVGLFEGYHRLKCLREEIEAAFNRLEEGQSENSAVLEHIEAGLKRLEAEQQKLNRQEIRNTILVEQIVANLPSSSDTENHV
ncbi:MAG: hypothetical protein ABSH56_21470 [Bryobacteraceae bacterium]